MHPGTLTTTCESYIMYELFDKGMTGFDNGKWKTHVRRRAWSLTRKTTTNHKCQERQRSRFSVFYGERFRTRLRLSRRAFTKVRPLCS